MPTETYNYTNATQDLADLLRDIEADKLDPMAAMDKMQNIQVLLRAWSDQQQKLFVKTNGQCEEIHKAIFRKMREREG